LGYTKTKLSPHQISILREKYGASKIEVSWGQSEFGILYIMGFKWCDRCTTMMKIDDINCPICNKRLRTGPKAKRK